jgi:sugar phosphate isomerase/epimerase
MNRKEFIQKSGMVAASAFLLPQLVSCTDQKKFAIGLQLYTLRDSIPQNPKEVLKQVASFGYQELETYGYNDGQIFGLPFSEYIEFVNGLGMKTVSGHYGLNQITGDTWKKAVEDAQKHDQAYMVLPYLNAEDRTSIDDYKKICEQVNKAGEVCNEAGVRFGYHNHDFEFQELEGQIPYDVMLSEIDPKNCGMEMDLYWVVRAGHDPVKYFEQHPGRFEQWHVKDMDKTDGARNADVGSGSIDFTELFKHAERSGLQHFFVEQESYPGDPLQSVKNSIDYLKKVL